MKTANPLSNTAAAGTAIEKKTTHALLTAGVIAGPIYVLVALVQGLTRQGFDLLRHDVSLLSNGPQGWIQISNFMLTGLLVIAAAVGMRRALAPGRGKTWGPILLGIYGLGLIGAGIFVADPMAGFPPGTPETTNTMSMNGLLHFVTGGVGFLALIAACFVFARRFSAQGQNGWAWYSVVTGIIFFAAFFGIASSAGASWSVIGFWIGVIAAWTWISVLSARLRRELDRG